MDQWGVGRKGFDDGLVIFFDMQPNLEHGQVQLYAGPGFRGDLPVERRAPGDLRERHAAARFVRATSTGRWPPRSTKVDAAASPEHAADLQRSRQINAVLGLVGAPIVFLGLSGWAFFHWRRYGKDPVYLDDPSVLMPAPPPDLTAASGAMVMDGSTSRRALTTAMLDLASRGLIAFREDIGRAARARRQEGRASTSARPPATPRSRPSAASTRDARPVRPRTSRSRSSGRSAARRTASSAPEDLPKFGSDVAAFDTGAREARRRSRLVRRATEQGRRSLDRPRRARDRRRRHRHLGRVEHPDLGSDAHRGRGGRWRDRHPRSSRGSCRP